MMDSDFTGLWMNADHSVRKVLLPNGRFIAMVGPQQTRYQGSYSISGSRIAYRKDSGAMGEGEFIDGVLYQGELALYPEGYAEMAA